MPGEIRVNQQGYLPGERKIAVLMAPTTVTGSFDVENGAGDVVLTGSIPATSAGVWNAGFPATYRLDLSPLADPGTYHVVVSGAVTATSPDFEITDAGSLYRELLTDGVGFDQAQRDGAHIITGALTRRPAHLLDRRARVYAWPRMVPGEDLITDRDLHPTGGRVDVEGGWADAGDYLKFTHSAAYNDVLLFTSARLLGDAAPRSLAAEARFGVRWLAKMWDRRTGVLHLQVGIGSGNRAGTFFGDHDGWRLPQADDHNTAHRWRYVRHRPVFDAAPAGRRISPNLAGRVSAAFALAAQADAADHPTRARRELRDAEALFDRAATPRPPRPLVTALPHAFYPESSWRDDMALGGAEIALARHALHEGPGRYLRAAAHWADLNQSTSDALNLYDVSALADTSVATALDTIDHPRLDVTRQEVVADLRRQIQEGIAGAADDPFGASQDLTEFDVDSRTFGLVATVALYDRLTGTARFQDFADQQRGWLLGANPWGVSAMIGVGDRFPRCPQHQVANLSGTTDGTPPVLVGAVVNGPNGRGNFAGGLGGFQDGMVHCTTDLTAYDGQGSRWVDDVRAWQTDEPALDMTGGAIIAAAAQWSLSLPAARSTDPGRMRSGR
ncbi:MAG: glycoside hydrolase family 9 protein [Nocardioidaceae bacterium]